MNAKHLTNTGQRELYLLILRTLCQGKELPRAEYIQIYRKHSERSSTFEWATMNMTTGKRECGVKTKSDHWRDESADAWVVRTIGLLVKRGILIITPKSNAPLHLQGGATAEPCKCESGCSTGG